MRGTILVVESEPSLLETIMYALIDEGYIVSGTTRSQEALAIIAENTIDLLVTDLNLLDSNAVDLIKRSRLFDPEIGAVVIADDSSYNTIMDTITAGINSVLIRPFNSAQLVKACTEAIARVHSLKEYTRLKALMPLFEVSKSIMSELRIDKLCNYIVRTVSTEVRADIVSLMLLNDSSQDLVLKAGIGVPQEMIGEIIPRSDEPLSYKAVANMVPIPVSDFVVPQPKQGSGIASTLYIPLVSRGNAIGVLKVGTRSRKRLLTKYDLEMLTILAGQAAAAIENANLFDKIRVEKSRLSRLVKKVFQAQEEERSRISDELHDTVVQWIVSASYHSQTAKALITRGKLPDAISELEEANRIIDQSIREIRRIIINLRPSLLSELGLLEALQYHLRAMEKETGIACHFTVQGKHYPLTWSHEITIYRIILEALNNIKKHSRATEMELAIWFSLDSVQVSIMDNGIGFDLAKTLDNVFQNGKLGLMNMQERANMVNGTLQIESNPDAGTRISLTIPIGKKRAGKHANGMPLSSVNANTEGDNEHY